MRWAYYLSTKEEEEGGREGERGASLREYQEMDLDEGHRRAREDFFFYREATTRRLAREGGREEGRAEGGRGRRRRRRAGRPGYALDVDMAAMTVGGVGGEREGRREGGRRKRRRRCMMVLFPRIKKRMEGEEEWEEGKKEGRENVPATASIMMRTGWIWPMGIRRKMTMRMEGEEGGREGGGRRGVSRR